MKRIFLVVAFVAACTGIPAPSPSPVRTVVAAPPLTPLEAQLRDAVGAHYADAVTLLQRSVDIQSQTLDLPAVRRTAELYIPGLRALGFDARWVPLPDSLRRAGHLVALHPGTKGPRILLIGHLDTV